MTSNPKTAGPQPLPMSRKEMEVRGWDACDVILITGDAYVDHPAFGAALIGRWLESLGWRVGIIAQPNVRDVNAFRSLGRPRLFWGVTAGNVDSQLAHLTVMRKRRRDDPYTPGGKAGRRPPNASIIYTACARHAFKGVPVILGGLEGSLRRFAYYDYWTDRIRRSILLDTKADLLVYGMGERAIAEVARRLDAGLPLHNIRGTAEVCRSLDALSNPVLLPAFEEVSAPPPEGHVAFLEMTRIIYRHLGPSDDRPLAQRHGARWAVIHPPALPLTTEEMDRLYNGPFTRAPHPSYGKQRIPAFEMIRDSVSTHRGCYGGCSFCAIAVHQGAVISSRSQDNILQEIRRMSRQPQFSGVITDLGGPTANMYRTGCRLGLARCHHRGCLYPDVCPNLLADHGPQLRLLAAAANIPGVRHVFVSSGIRHDLALSPGAKGYLDFLCRGHLSGRLKIAPEHVAAGPLRAMRKPDTTVRQKFLDRFQAACRKAGVTIPVVEYFISGHPGCTLSDMIELAQCLRAAGLKPDQVQDFYPAPLTPAAAMYYTGLDPFTGKPVYVPRSDREKALQRALLLCHQPAFHRKAREALREAGRQDLIGRGPHTLVPPGP